MSVHFRRRTVAASVIALLVAGIFVLVLPQPLAGAKSNTPANNCTWTGAASGDWLNASNWSGCASVVPGSGDDVTLPGGSLPHEPSLSTGSASVNSLAVDISRTLTLGAGRALTLSVSLNNAGLITGAGTLRTNGATHLTQSGGLFAPLEIAGGTATAATATYSGSVTVDSGAILRPDCGSTVTVAGSVTVTGTLADYCGAIFLFQGPLVTNNGSISVNNFSFVLTGTQAVAGGGAWINSILGIGTGSVLSTASPVTMAVPSIYNSGVLSLTNPLLLTGTVQFNNLVSGIVGGSGPLQTIGSSNHLSQLGSFSAPIEDVSGLLRAVGSFKSSLTVDAGATFTPECGGLVTFAGSVTVNGTLADYCGAAFVFDGPLFTNNGSVSVQSFTFGLTGTQSVAGAGAWIDSALGIAAGSIVRTTSPVTMAVGIIYNSGVLSLTNPLLLTGTVQFNNQASSVVGGSGPLQTMGSGIHLSQLGSSFSAPIEDVSGLLRAVGSFSGTLTVDAGATFTPECGGLVTFAGSVTVNGTLADYCGATFLFVGPVITNNGTVSVLSFVFGLTGTQSVTGGGTWTGYYLTFASGSTTVQASDISLANTSFTINGTFNGAAYTLTIDSGMVLYGSGTHAFHGLAISAAHALNANAKNFGVSGNWLNAGTLGPGGNTVTFNGLGALQAYSGTTTFANLIVAPSAVVETGISFMLWNISLTNNGQVRHTPPAAVNCGSSEVDGFNQATLALSSCTGTGFTSAVVRSAAGGLFPSVPLGSDPAYDTCSPSPQLTRRYWQIAPNGSGARTANVVFAYQPSESFRTPNEVKVYHCVAGFWRLQAVPLAYGVNGAGNNTVTATGLALGGSYVLANPSDIVAAKTESASPAIVGDVLTYTLAISNSGIFTATAVNITDVLPVNTAFVTAGASQGSCAGTSTLTCNLADIPVGGYVTVTLAVRPLLVGTITNTVVATSNPPDLNFADDSASVTAIITPSVMITVADTSVAIRMLSTTTAVFTVTLDAPSGAPITVTYATADGSAIAGADYTATSGMLVFAPGVTTQFVSVTVASKLAYQQPKMFVLNLTGTINGIIARNQATGTILNNLKSLFLPLIKR